MHGSQGVKQLGDIEKKILFRDSCIMGKDENAFISGLHVPNICTIVPSIFSKFKYEVTKNFKMAATGYLALFDKT